MTEFFVLGVRASMTKATLVNPRHVATYVRPATHKLFGASTPNRRSTGSAGRAATESGSVVHRRRVLDAELVAARQRIHELETELAIHRRATELLREQTADPEGGTRPSR